MRVAQAIPQNQVKADELAQFDTVYHQFHQAVYANICKLVCEPQMAEDILQEVFISLWENRQTVNLQDAGGWLFVVSYNKSMTFLKKKLRETSVILPDTEYLAAISEEQPVDEELFQLRLSMVEEAIDHLPPRKREVFRLCRYDGKSYDEVADMLNISVVSVKDYLKQSTQFIRQYISRHYNNIEIPGMYLLLIYFSQQG
ncbi:sigma-70 family RNA polymerase sigma factor [Pseudobacter ginsenosidimutans]|uniref:RNA polymerase sigma-70 factor (ECF subfamily) n=1 Tax=Pseudobacter ginsenosidimutans TaxID=661488 RepID=A0A4Q7MUE7_9BACT|nr:sigma-70 family RNA polymerase sigma factor [Pseudobacter ginsenosidimutans]QEC42437.1 sigma-70 family RNA polymerase sigma factor [Pseudobacter ginsenosidimutans]RZS70713.1 RNA polymerase sigma-70 factor (ECF subfamily) [Pseudobacter ginsenosidimutans]